MKNTIAILICLNLIIGTLAAQTPNAFKYQAVVRDHSGQIIVDKNVGFRISILQTSASGTVVYSEKHTTQTNAFGLINLEIGNGTNVSGIFSTIDWASGSYFVKIELDANNSGLFSEMGTSQLLAVPYALYAENAGNGFSGSWVDLTSKPNLFSGNYTDLLNKPNLFSGSYPDLTNKPNLATVATSGSYGDLLNKPTLFSGSYTDLTNKPTYATVATSGKYTDLLNTPNLAAVATSGSFTDLTNKPNFIATTANPFSGDVLYYNGTAWQLLPKGVNGQTLRLENGLPKWGEPGYALPMVTTNAVTDVLQTGATSGGNVIATGYSDITARGVCWNTNQNPTTANSKTTEAVGIGTFTSTLSGLLANTTYYARAYATNSAGTAYGNQVTFKTFVNVVFPTVTTNEITNITANAVTSGGNVTATGGGEVTARGVCWSDHQNPVITDSKTTDGTGTGQYQSQIAGLIPGSFYARAYATNSAGTGYGNMVTFTTEKTLPVLTTKNITSISALGAVSGGLITSAGGGSISAKGVCWSELTSPTINDYIVSSGSGNSQFNSAIINAVPSTLYYVRSFATNEIGTSYGDQKTFTTTNNVNFFDFETGVLTPGWGGQWTVSSDLGFQSNYALRSLNAVNSDATLSITIANSGQISFYYYFNGGTSIEFYIDNVLQMTYPNSSDWNQSLMPVSAGTHIFKWHFNRYCWSNPGGSGCNGTVYIDNITLPK